jgi:hypothetical protein
MTGTFLQRYRAKHGTGKEREEARQAIAAARKQAREEARDTTRQAKKAAEQEAARIQMEAEERARQGECYTRLAKELPVEIMKAFAKTDKALTILPSNVLVADYYYCGYGGVTAKAKVLTDFNISSPVVIKDIRPLLHAIKGIRLGHYHSLQFQCNDGVFRVYNEFGRGVIENEFRTLLEPPASWTEPEEIQNPVVEFFLSYLDLKTACDAARQLSNNEVIIEADGKDLRMVVKLSSKYNRSSSFHAVIGTSEAKFRLSFKADDLQKLVAFSSR